MSSSFNEDMSRMAPAFLAFLVAQSVPDSDSSGVIKYSIFLGALYACQQILGPLLDNSSLIGGTNPPALQRQLNDATLGGEWDRAIYFTKNDRVRVPEYVGW